MDREKLREHWEDLVGHFKRLINKVRRRVPQILNDEPEEPKTIIIVDLDGGDKAPQAPKRGIKKAINEGFIEPEEIIAIGTPAAVKEFYTLSWIDRFWRLFRIFKNPLDEVLVMECPDKIEMDDDYTAIRRKRKTSAIGIGINMIKAGQATTLVSAGNTAAMVGLGAIILGKKRTNLKPAIAVPLPNESGQCLILDAGAIHRATSLDLLNCAILGSAYAQEMWGIEKPIVRLLNIGSESGKGNEDLKTADELLTASSLSGDINYQGNIEGDKVFTAEVNVIVCSGEMGNNTIKVAEGVLNLIKDKMGFFWKVISFFWEHHKGADYKKVGGAVLLGLLTGILIICHGKSNYMAIASGISRGKHEARLKALKQSQPEN